jgi:hypothetical protein
MSQTCEAISITFEAANQKTSHPYANHLVLGTSRQVLPVRAEADAADVEIAADISRVVLQDAELLARVYVVNLGRAVATSSHKFAVCTESHTANHAFVLECMCQIDVQYARDVLIEDGKPILTRLLERGRQALRI